MHKFDIPRCQDCLNGKGFFWKLVFLKRKTWKNQQTVEQRVNSFLKTFLLNVSRKKRFSDSNPDTCVEYGLSEIPSCSNNNIQQRMSNTEISKKPRSISGVCCVGRGCNTCCGKIMPSTQTFQYLLRVCACSRRSGRSGCSAHTVRFNFDINKKTFQKQWKSAFF